jgi:hypothetical protein
MKEAMGFFDFVSDSFEQVYWVPGNHEYYRSDINHRTGEISERIRSNVSLVNNVSVEHKGVRLVFLYPLDQDQPGKGVCYYQGHG